MRALCALKSSWPCISRFEYTSGAYRPVGLGTLANFFGLRELACELCLCLRVMLTLSAPVDESFLLRHTTALSNNASEVRPASSVDLHRLRIGIACAPALYPVAVASASPFHSQDAVLHCSASVLPVLMVLFFVPKLAIASNRGRWEPKRNRLTLTCILQPLLDRSGQIASLLAAISNISDISYQGSP
jgi:hypothetical protein